MAESCVQSDCYPVVSDHRASIVRAQSGHLLRQLGKCFFELLGSHHVHNHESQRSQIHFDGQSLTFAGHALKSAAFQTFTRGVRLLLI